MENYSSYVAPLFNISPDNAPFQVAAIHVDAEHFHANFWRSAEWAPDGSSILAQSENHTMHIYRYDDTEKEQGNRDSMKHIVSCKQASPILSYKWFPTASVHSPESFCYTMAARDCPVKLVDGQSGSLRASYKIVDHRERHVAPHSLSFNPTATKLYCGCESAIEVFDVQSPGEGDRLFTTPRKKEKGGFKGILSSLAFCPDYSGVYAAASLSSGIALLSEDTGSQILTYIDSPSGTTQVKFHPTDPNILLSTSRPGYAIRTWDIRNTSESLREYNRNSSSNQRLIFDVDYSGRWLSCGDANGDISFFDLHAEETSPLLKFRGHDDVIGSVSFHVTSPLLLSVSGSRRFDSQEALSSPVETSDSESQSAEEPGATAVRQKLQRGDYLHRPRDPSLRIWRFPPDEASLVGS